jgi:hypothetical protein
MGRITWTMARRNRLGAVVPSTSSGERRRRRPKAPGLRWGGTVLRVPSGVRAALVRCAGIALRTAALFGIRPGKPFRSHQIESIWSENALAQFSLFGHGREFVATRQHTDSVVAIPQFPETEVVPANVRDRSVVKDVAVQAGISKA